MKSIDSLKNIPVIMMSSDGEMEIVATCMDKGAADYIVKPIRYISLKLFKIFFWYDIKTLKMVAQNF